MYLKIVFQYIFVYRKKKNRIAFKPLLLFDNLLGQSSTFEEVNKKYFYHQTHLYYCPWLKKPLQ